MVHFVLLCFVLSGVQRCVNKWRGIVESLLQFNARLHLFLPSDVVFPWIEGIAFVTEISVNKTELEIHHWNWSIGHNHRWHRFQYIETWFDCSNLSSSVLPCYIIICFNVARCFLNSASWESEKALLFLASSWKNEHVRDQNTKFLTHTLDETDSRSR